jgi:hypothetical protein
MAGKKERSSILNLIPILILSAFTIHGLAQDKGTMLKNCIRTFLFGILILLVSACSDESYSEIDPAEFNASIAVRTDISSAEALIEIYYNYPEEEGTTQISIESKRMNRNKVAVTLIHDRLADDSLRAIKITMIAKQVKGRWEVLSIRKQWRCYEGRGHTDWGIEFCK